MNMLVLVNSFDLHDVNGKVSDDRLKSLYGEFRDRVMPGLKKVSGTAAGR